MQPITLRIVSDDGLEATIHCDGSHGGYDDYYALVTVPGRCENRKVYGVDPVQAFSLGLSLIELETEARRFRDDKAKPINSVAWRIEV